MSDETFYCSFVSIHYIVCECGETFPNEEELKEHLECDPAHKKEKKEFQCGICDCTFSSEEACINHYEGSHIIQSEHDYVEVHSQDDEDVKFREIQYGEDIPYEEVQYDVVPCDKTTNDDEEQYYVVKCEDIINDQYVVQCEYMNDEDVEYEEVRYEDAEVIDTKSSVDAEKLIKEVDPTNGNTGKKQTRRRKKNASVTNSIVCEVCGKKCSSNAALTYHLRVHTGERPYKCTWCPKSFGMPLYLQSHIRTHTGERPFQCPSCPKAFINRAALLRHDRTHTGIKPYKCPTCAKTFTQSNSMKLHVKTVHLKMPAPYKSKTRRKIASEREMRQSAMLNSLEDENDTAVQSIMLSKDMIKTEVIEPETSNAVYKDTIQPKSPRKSKIPSKNMSNPKVYVEPMSDDMYQQQLEQTHVLLEEVKQDVDQEITYEIIYDGQ